MPGSPKPTDWLNKIPGWLTAAFALIGGVAAFIVDFRTKWQLFTVVTIALILLYLLLLSLYVLLARRKTRSKTTPWSYQYGQYRYVGWVGVAAVGLAIALTLSAPPTREFVVEGVLGTPTPVPTITPSLTATLQPTATLAPTATPPQLPNPDVVIADFDGSQASKRFDVAGQLEQSLLGYFRQQGSADIQLRLVAQVVSDEGGAQSLVNETHAKVLVWGRYDDSYIQVRLFLTGNEQAGSDVASLDHIGLDSPDPMGNLSFKVQGVVSENLTFLAPFVLGLLRYHSNDYAAGHDAFDFAMQHIPTTVILENDAILHFFQARQLTRQGGAAEKSICEYTQAILQDPQFDIAYNNLGLVIGSLYGRDLPLAATLASPMSDNAVTCLHQLQQAGLLGTDLADPKAYFQWALKLNDHLTLAKFNLYAFEWMQVTDPDSLPPILTQLEDIQRADSSILGTYILLATSKENQGDAAGAFQMYQAGLQQMSTASERDPKKALMRFNVGQMLTQQQNWPGAEVQYKYIVDADENDLRARLSLGNLYFRQGDYPKAMTEFEALLHNQHSMDSNKPIYQAEAAVLSSAGLFQQGDLAGAIEYLNEANQISPKNPFTNLLLGLLYPLDGKNELAVKALDDAQAFGETFKWFGWRSFASRCLRAEELQGMSYADWVLNKLPTSNCLDTDLSDPHARIKAVFKFFSDELTQDRVQPVFSFTSAQCPFVYTEDPLTGQWAYQTTILYKLVNHEAAQLRPLAQFHGRLLIREMEPEESHINRLYVLAKLADGTFKVLEPNLPELQQVDTQYLVLQQNDQRIITLQNYSAADQVIQWWVMAVGYYIPLDEYH